MTIDYNNLYVHFVFNTSGRVKLIQEKHRIRIEKYITGITKNLKSRLYAIYANAEHMHILISKSRKYPNKNLQLLSPIVHRHLSIKIAYALESSPGSNHVQHSRFPKMMLKGFATIFLISLNTMRNILLRKNIRDLLSFMS